MINVKLSTATSLPVTLFDSSTGNPKTGVTATDVSCYYIKQGDTAETTKVLTGKWTEVDAVNMAGFYMVAFDVADLNALGVFVYYVRGTGIVSFEGVVQIVEYLPDDILRITGEEDADADGQVL